MSHRETSSTDSRSKGAGRTLEKQSMLDKLIAEVGPEPGLSETEQRRILARLRAAPTASVWRPWRLAAVTAMLVLLSAAGGIAAWRASIGSVHRSNTRALTPSQPSIRDQPPKRVPAQSKLTPNASQGPAAMVVPLAESPKPASRAVRQHRRIAQRNDTSSTVANSGAAPTDQVQMHEVHKAQPSIFVGVPQWSDKGTAPSPSSEALRSPELAAFAASVGSLRRNHDPTAALRGLDEYLAAYPKGLFTSEARALRAEALLLVGHRGAALAALVSLVLTDDERGLQLRQLRGELWADKGACGSALIDFDHVIAAHGSDSLAERAFYGRGVCQLHLGQRDQSRTTFNTYLDRFPQGRFAQVVREAIGL